MTEVGQKPEEKKGDIKIAQGRSPAYPFISLGEAIELAQKLHGAGATRTALPPETLYAIWKIGPQSSAARQSLAALNHFGLVDYIGRGDDRKVKLSDLALKILLDRQPLSPERDRALRQAALTPPIHAELFQKYERFLPSDLVMETFLTRDRGYNPQGAQSLIGEYKATLEYAGLDKPDNMPAADGGEGAEIPPSPHVAVGDLVQIEIGGALQLPKPARVRAIQEHEGKQWVFIEGSETGIPLEQTVVQAKGSAPSASAPPRLPEGKPEQPGRTVSPFEGEREWLRGPLSKTTSYRLIVSGEIGPKEIGKLIKLLKAQQAVLSDDEEELEEDETSQ